MVAALIRLVHLNYQRDTGYRAISFGSFENRNNFFLEQDEDHSITPDGSSSHN
jgi:hypothetical protein